MKIRAVVEFDLTQEIEDGVVPEPELDKLVDSMVKIADGPYENLYMGVIMSAEEIVD